MSTETIVMNKVSACHVRENYAAIVGEVAPKKLDDVVAGLDKHLRGLGIELGQCDVCGAWSPEVLSDGSKLDACPYCNDGMMSAPKAPPAPKPTASLVEISPEQKKAAKKAKAEKAEATPVLASSAPLILAPKGAMKGSQQELDESLARFKEAVHAGADSYYRMGIELKKMRDYLWQQRVAEDGKPKYKSYKQFYETELDISHGTEVRARGVVENFTHEQFVKFGAYYLTVMLAAPKKEHAALMERIETGEIASPRDLEKEVSRIREREGVEVIESDSVKEAKAKGRNVPTAAATAAAAKARKKPSAAVTIGLKSETGAGDVLAKPLKAGEDPRAARTLEDKPYFKIEGINGVTLAIAIKVKPNGELTYQYTTQRDEEE